MMPSFLHFCNVTAATNMMCMKQQIVKESTVKHGHPLTEAVIPA